ncbi:MAG: hypothetical protein ACREEE_09190 [Dongiaceae bacterium]
MRRSIHLFLVMALVVAGMATNGWMVMPAFAKPLAEPVSAGGESNACDACGGRDIAAMTCGMPCTPMIVEFAPVALAAPGPKSVAWTWSNQMIHGIDLKPEPTPPRA